MTKYAIVFLAASAFSTGAWADHIYGELGRDNPDLEPGHVDDQMVGTRPGVGTSFDVYHGLANGNPDLFQRREYTGESGLLPDIYRGLNGSPDTNF